MESDPNERVLHASERINRLTNAVDVMVAREFIVQQKEATLDDLEAYVTSIEAEVAEIESDIKKVRNRCALLRPDRRCARAGEDSGVSTMWLEYGESMQYLFAKHAAKLMELEGRLKEMPNSPAAWDVAEQKRMSKSPSVEAEAAK